MNLCYHPTTEEMLANLSNRALQVHIFHGPEHIGKLSAARMLASQILDNPTIATSADLADKNLFHLQAQEGKQAVGIEQIRELITSLYKKSHMGSNKVVIIENIDKISSSGQNAMLKVLEESPTDTTFFLLAQNLASVLPTILSRSSQTYFARPENKTVAMFLTNEHGIDEAKAQQLAALSHGLVGWAVRLLDAEQYTLAQELKNAADAFISQDITGRFLVAKNVAEKKQTRQFLSELSYAIAEQSTILQKVEQHETITKAQQNISQNANERITLEAVALTIKGDEL